MSKRTVVPYGPQHPALLEPVHIDLVLEDEKVVEAIPTVGFVHRGLESLAPKRNFNDYLYVFERICGICSFMHGMAYCEGIEDIFGREIPPRAKYLRTIWCELSRLHSHMLWLGLTADAFGFDALFMQCWKLREKILDMFEASTGGRLIFSVNKVGGVLRDMPSDMLKSFKETLLDMKPDIKKVADVFMNDYSVQSRLKGVGYLSREDAVKYGACGPFMRASGVKLDSRMLGYDAYKDLEFDIPTSTEGDGYARCEVRIKEIFESINIISQAVDKIPDGEIAIKIPGNPSGESFVRVEQPRGEALYYINGNGTPYLNRARVRTPTFANIASLCKILPGCDFADVGVQVLTIDPCISCTER